jgi:hypothetical protein
MGGAPMSPLSWGNPKSSAGPAVGSFRTIECARVRPTPVCLRQTRALRESRGIPRQRSSALAPTKSRRTIVAGWLCFRIFQILIKAEHF